ncbi:MAG: hypothetical protein KAI17_01160 [Thiotrichaceae bacterium]|nr:hypothetical protein [Thiotrichaceae bacterium]
MARITWKNAWVGGVVYALGDSIATLVTGEFQYQRMLGMMILGGGLLAWEIPTYFQYLERRFNQPGYMCAIKRTLLAALFFNPLWIARHMLFIKVFAGRWQEIALDILVIATQSFNYCFPVSLLVNFIIQNKVSLKWRFVVSSSYSALMAIYFALSGVFFA